VGGWVVVVVVVVLGADTEAIYNIYLILKTML